MIILLNFLCMTLELIGMIIATKLDNIVLLDWCAMWFLFSAVMVAMEFYKEKPNAIRD